MINGDWPFSLSLLGCCLRALVICSEESAWSLLLGHLPSLLSFLAIIVQKTVRPNLSSRKVEDKEKEREIESAQLEPASNDSQTVHLILTHSLTPLYDTWEIWSSLKTKRLKEVSAGRICSHHTLLNFFCWLTESAETLKPEEEEEKEEKSMHRCEMTGRESLYLSLWSVIFPAN